MRRTPIAAALVSLITALLAVPAAAAPETVACGNPAAGSCCVSQSGPFCADAECCTLICGQDPFCCNNRWDGICAAAARSQCEVCSCSGGAKALFVPFSDDGSWTPVLEGVANGSTGALDLGFAFDLFGTTYTSCFVNAKGNLTFKAPFALADGSGFPVGTPPMVAPFWADIRLDLGPTGKVWTKRIDADGDGALDTFVVTWNAVVGPTGDTGRRNTFQAVLTDGTHPGLAKGVRVALSYGEMCWGPESFQEDLTAPVGVVGAGAGAFALVGRFGPGGEEFDGPEGEADGFDFLDERLFTFRLLPNEPPACDDCPRGGTIVVPQDTTFERTLTFTGPERGQSVSLRIVNAAEVAARGVAATLVDGPEATVRLVWTPGCCDTVPVPIDLVATDDFENPAASAVRIELVSECTSGPDVVVVDGSVPAAVPVGSPLAVAWNARNDGEAAAAGVWIDRVFLSPGPVFGPSSLASGSAGFGPGTLAPGAGYSSSITVAAPNSVGTWFVHVVPDALDELCERTGGEGTPVLIGQVEVASGCGLPTAGPCCTPHGGRFCNDAACCTAVCAIDPFCCNNQWDSICASEAQDLCAVCNQPTVCSGNGLGLRYPFADDGSWSPVLVDVDNGSQSASLPFAFAFFGELHVSCFVNANGNVTFGAPSSITTLATFPIAGPRMIAPFLADADLRGTASGNVWRKDLDRSGDGAIDTVVFTWDDVGRAPLDASRLNTFQVILTDGTNPDLEPGANIAVSFDNMCWTTGDFDGGEGGFGGQPALVGVNRGDGTSGVLLGRFNRNDASYDGPDGETDGVDFLDGRLFQTDVAANRPPVAVDFPAGGSVSAPAGQTLDVTLAFAGPEANQTVSLAVPDAAALAARGIDLSFVPGTTATLRILWTPGCCDTGTVPVQVVATDSATPQASASFTLAIAVTCPDGPDLVLGSPVAPAAALVGQAIDIGWTGTNAGAATGAASWIDRVMLSPDEVLDGDEIALASLPATFAALPAGTAYERTVTTILPAVTGTFFVLVAGDADDTLCERDGAESNVLVAGTLVIAPNAPPTCPAYPPGGVVAASPGSTIDLTLEFLPPEADQATTLLVFNEAAITSRGALVTRTEGNPSTLRIQWAPDCCDAGIHEILVRATDSLASPAHADFPLRFAITCPDGPDLVVTQASAPTSGFVGQLVAVTWTGRNEGNAVEGANWRDRVRIDGPGGATVVVQNAFPTFAAGQQYTRTVAIALPPVPGTYPILIDADLDDSLCERDGGEVNLRHVGDVTVTVPPRPDLVVEGISPVSDGVLSGSDVKLSFTVRNVGEAPTSVPSWRDLVILSPDAELVPPPVPLGAEQVLLDPLNPQFLLPGESYRRDVEVRLPSDFSGSRRLAIVADATPFQGQGSPFAVAESDESNNVAFSLPFEVELEPQPDLKGVSITVPSNAFSGTYFDISATVENRGDGPADPNRNWTYGIWLSTDQSADLSPGDIFLGQRTSNIVGMPAGDIRALQTVALTPVSLSGQFFVKLQLDNGNVVSEFGFEGNNVFASASPVEIFLSPPVDLVVTTPVPAPSVSYPGHPVRVSWQGSNEGAPLLTSQVVTWIDRLYLSSDATLDPTDLALADRQRNTLDLGPPPRLYDYTSSADIRLPEGLAAGTHFLIVRGDETGVFFEGDCPDACETNNVAAVPITVEARFADLVATDATPPSSGAAGQVIGLAWTVRNQGEVVTPVNSWSDRVVLVGPGVEVEFLARTRAGPVAPGGSYPVSANAALPLVPPGEYQLVIRADGSGQCFEGPGEGNNAISFPFTITGDGANLVVDSVVPSGEPVAGEPFTVEAVVRNAGNRTTAAASWYDTCFLSRDPTVDAGDIVLASRGRGAALEPDAGYVQAFTGTVPVGATGPFFLLVRADEGRQVFETSEGDNVGAIPSSIEVAPPRLPNLTVTSVVRVAGGVAGQPISVTWTVANDSPFPLEGGQWRDSVYLSLDQFLDTGSDLHLGTVGASGPLDPEGTYGRTRTFDVPSGLTGSLYLIVRTDALGQVAESNESDNDLAAPSDTEFTLPLPSDLVVDGVAAGSGELVLGRTHEFSRTLRNAGDQPVAGAWKDSIYLSTDAAWSIDDRRLGSFQTVVGSGSPLVPGATVTETGFATVTGVTPGTYRLVARTDVFNAISETDETNNVNAGAATVTVRAERIELGTTFEGVQFGPSDVRYFEFEAPADEPILVEFEHLNPSANIELFVRHGEVPTSGRFDASGGAPGEPRQQALVGRSRAGTYYVLVRNGGMVGPGASFTIRASVVPYSVLAVEPTVVGTAGTATLAIEGARFDRHTVAELVDADGGVHRPVWARIESPTLIHATYDLTGAAAGPCDLRIASRYAYYDVDPVSLEVVLLERFGGEFTLPAAISIVAGGGPSVAIDTVAPLFVRLGSPFNFAVSVSNTGLNDAPMPVLQVASPDGSPLSLEAPGVSAGGLQQQFVGIGGRNGLMLAPGEAIVVPVYARAQALGRNRIIVQDLSGDASPVAWDALEPYYRRENAPETWPQTWANFRSMVGPTWNSLHRAMRLAAGDLATATGTRVLGGAELIGYMLDRAELGQFAVEDFSTPESGIFLGRPFLASESTGNPFPGGGVAGGTPCEPEGGCQPYDGTCLPQTCPCEPFFIPGEIAAAETFLEAFFLAGKLCTDVEVASAYTDFLSNEPREGRIMIGDDDTDQLLADLQEGQELEIAAMDLGNRALNRLKQCFASGGCEEQLPANTPVSFPLSSLLNACELDPVIAFDGQQDGVCGAAKLLLGGGGRGGNDGFNIQCPPDQRVLSANLVLLRETDDCGRTKRIKATLKDISWRIVDTIDFCPGNPGDSAERLITHLLCRLEASGSAFDIGIDLTVPRPDIALRSFEPRRLNCPSPETCPEQPPGSGCAAPCTPSGLQDQCTEDEDNDGGKPCEGEETAVEVVASFDPNLKTGPVGFGPENWTSAVAPLPYRIDFENLPEATAPAGRVTIVDSLDPRLNPLSVRLGDLMLSNRAVEVPDDAISFQAEVDLVAERGVIVEITAGVDITSVPARVFWIFQSIDPATGEPPLDPFLGFLPPEDGTGRGQGHVNFTVKPKSSTPNGAVVSNEAEITFDANAPLLTNRVANTLDRSLPSSLVLPLPAVTPGPTLPLTVAGSDAEGGSGIAEFRLFVSTDGGPYEMAGASADGSFISPILLPGRVYGFASRAVDRAGGEEPLPETPDAVVAVPTVELAPASDTGVTGDGITNDRTPAVAIVSAPSTAVAIAVAGRGEAITAVTDASGRATAVLGGESGLPDGAYTVLATAHGLTVSTVIVIDTEVEGELAWSVRSVHGDAGAAISPLPAGTPFVESRLGGLAEIRVGLAGSTCTTGAIGGTVTGTALDGDPVPSPAVAVVAAEDGWTVRLEPPLSVPGVYCVTLAGANDCAGNPRPLAQRRRTVVMLPGDATGDRRVNNTDVGGVASLLGTDPIDTSNALHLRSDVDRDGEIDGDDLSQVLAARGADARFIVPPCPVEGGDAAGLVGGGDGSADGRLAGRAGDPVDGPASPGTADPSRAADPDPDLADPEATSIALAILPVPGAEVAVANDPARFGSVVPWGDASWQIADVSAEQLERLERGEHAGVVAFSSPVRAGDGLPGWFGGRDLVVVLDAASLQSSIDAIFTEIPVIEAVEWLEPVEGMVFARLSTTLPDASSVQSLAAALVARGLVLDATPERHFVTAMAREAPEAILERDAEERGAPAMAGTVVILASDRTAPGTAVSVDVRDAGGAEALADRDAAEGLLTLLAYRDRADGLLVGRSWWRIRAFVTAIGLSPDAVIDVGRGAPRETTVDLLRRHLRELPPPASPESEPVGAP